MAALLESAVRLTNALSAGVASLGFCAPGPRGPLRAQKKLALKSAKISGRLGDEQQAAASTAGPTGSTPSLFPLEARPGCAALGAASLQQRGQPVKRVSRPNVVEEDPGAPGSGVLLTEAGLQQTITSPCLLAGKRARAGGGAIL